MKTDLLHVPQNIVYIEYIFLLWHVYGYRVKEWKAEYKKYKEKYIEIFI